MRSIIMVWHTRDAQFSGSATPAQHEPGAPPSSAAHSRGPYGCLNFGREELVGATTAARLHM